MEPFKTLTGVAVPMLTSDINTDQIAPIQLQRRLKPDYGEILFARSRRKADGTLNEDFVLNKPQFQTGRILVTGSNFGCGSSREAAVWCLQSFGFRCLIARSVADIFRENCLQNGVLPVELDGETMAQLEQAVVQSDGRDPFTADLVSQTISGPSGLAIHFDISADDRTRLLEGLDEIGVSLKFADSIARWEASTRQAMPWLQRAVRTDRQEDKP